VHDLDRHREINGAHEALPFYWLWGLQTRYSRVGLQPAVGLTNVVRILLQVDSMVGCL
jgi:hypothetical protein